MITGRGTASTRTARVIAAAPEALYRAFTDPAALVAWLPPGDMTGRMHRFEPGVGGGYLTSLYYPPDEPAHRGKTTAAEDRVEVRFVDLVPARRIVSSVRFVTDDPALQALMTMTATFEPVAGGTEVTLVFSGLPSGLRPEDNDAGARLSLAQLARWVEG
jgi:uncharacterized protein YndB with AHSA1/START domain